MLDDAHAEAGQAASRLAGTQVEMVGTAGGTAGTLHVGLGGVGGDGMGDMVLSPPPRAWGHAGRGGTTHLAVALPAGVAALADAAAWVALALHTGDARLCGGVGGDSD